MAFSQSIAFILLCAVQCVVGRPPTDSTLSATSTTTTTTAASVETTEYVGSPADNDHIIYIVSNMDSENIVEVCLY